MYLNSPSVSDVYFELPDDFIDQYKGQQPDWGPIGYVTYKRTYARTKDDGTTEEWWETCRRVIEGTFTIQKRHCTLFSLPWYRDKAMKTATEMYDRMFDFRWSPPGRGIWNMGMDYIYERTSAPLQNCAFRSTKGIDENFRAPFRFLMNMSLLGVGVGGDVRGAGKVTIKDPKKYDGTYRVHDSREGWSNLISALIGSYARQNPKPVDVDYSSIREKGEPIDTFGGVAPGPEPLKKCYRTVEELLERHKDEKISSGVIVDLFNIIGRAVVSGGLRRTAEIMLGSPNDSEFINLKDPDKHSEKLEQYRWASNNSIMVENNDREHYEQVGDLIRKNGEPGVIWIDNCRNFGRMKDGRKDGVDAGVEGVNPCQPAFAEVLSKDGITKFGDVVEGDEIWTEEGWSTIIDKWSNGVKEVYKYHTTAGSFIGTEDHRIVSHGDKVEVQDADEIDLLAGPRDGKVKELSDNDKQLIMDGLVFGDGHVKRQKDRDYSYKLLTIGDNDQDYFGSEISELISHQFDGKSYKIETNLEDKELPRTFNRSIPDRYYEADERTKCMFLRGLFTANGGMNDNRVELRATSFDVIEQVQTMLSSVGIRSYYTTDKPETIEFDNGEYVTKESYKLNITTDRNEFFNKIGFIQNYKQEELKEAVESVNRLERRKSHEIRDVEYLGEYEVFDITVDNEPHTYWTGGLNVSNCGEQTLEDGELCTLVESYPINHDSLDDWKKTLKFSYLYAKSVTLAPTHNERSNQIMQKNRRIGCSVTGITQAFTKFGKSNFFEACDEAYEKVQYWDEVYSDWLGVPRSIKTTSVKPSGTVSQLPGVTSGIHYPQSQYFIRNVRFQKTSDLLPYIEEAGYEMEEDKYSDDTVVVSFPVEQEYFDRSEDDVSMWEQFENTAKMQHYWSDNAVSTTVKFSDDDAEDIEEALELYGDRLKTLSLLPKEGHGYEQAPYIEISKEEYEEKIENVEPVSKYSDEIDGNKLHDREDKFCSGESCKVDLD